LVSQEVFREEEGFSQRSHDDENSPVTVIGLQNLSVLKLAGLDGLTFSGKFVIVFKGCEIPDTSLVEGTGKRL
jgi:hypothetical protein